MSAIGAKPTSLRDELRLIAVWLGLSEIVFTPASG